VAIVLGGLGACNSGSTTVDSGYLSWTPSGLWLVSPAGSDSSGVVTIENIGFEPANVTSIVVTGATRPVFTISPPGTTSLEIPEDAGVDVTIIYAPLTCLDGGDDRAELDFATDVPDAPSYALPLVGICTPAPVATDAG
jgi:hypothetical protein